MLCRGSATIPPRKLFREVSWLASRKPPRRPPYSRRASTTEINGNRHPALKGTLPQAIEAAPQARVGSRSGPGVSR